MKILLANPPCCIPLNRTRRRFFVKSGSRWPFSVIEKKKRPVRYVPFPFHLAYAASLLKNNKYRVFVLDAVALNLNREEFMKRAVSLQPRLVFFEVFTPTAEYDLAVAKRLKKDTGAAVVLAGPHASVFFRRLMEDIGEIDYILSGEYEFSLLNLINCIRDNDYCRIPGIPGICRREGNNIIFNQQPHCRDINQLPPPARELFPSNRQNGIHFYNDGFCQFQPAVQIQSSRGCIFRCDFCLWNQAVYREGPYRAFLPERVVDEIEDCREKYGPAEFYFDDDSFTIDKKRVLSICRQIKSRKLDIKWSCMADAVTLDEQMLEAMHDSGCIGIKFGVESAAKNILTALGKPVDLEKVKMVINWCNRRRIKCHAAFIFGLPGETPETMEKSLDFAREAKLDSVQFSIAVPFPGTRYYRRLKENDKIRKSPWLDYDGAGKSVVKYKNLSRQKLIRFHSLAFRRWLWYKMRKPGWWQRQLRYFFRAFSASRSKVLFIKKNIRAHWSAIRN